MTGWIGALNRLLLLLSLFLLLSAGGLWLAQIRKRNHLSLSTPSSPSQLALKSQPSETPLNHSLWQLHYQPPSVELPDLSKELCYLSIDDRPDTPESERQVHLTLKKQDKVLTTPLNRPLFLEYDKDQGQHGYRVCKESSLWIIPKYHPARPTEITIQVGMRNQEGDLVGEPAGRRRFTLVQTAQSRASQSNTWMLGEHRADNSLLARMRTRWIGRDEFVHLYSEGNNATYRLDFGEPEAGYSCFLQPGGMLYWDGNRWCEPEADTRTRDYPILCIRDIDDRMVHVDVWNTDGLGHLTLSLLRHRDTWQPEQIAQQLKLAGARNWSSFVLEYQSQRIEVSPDDWLLLSNGVWNKLEGVEELDEVVQRQRVGELLVIDKVERKGGRTTLIGHLFSPLRNSVKQLELPMSQNSSATDCLDKNTEEFL